MASSSISTGIINLVFIISNKLVFNNHLSL
nr:MAG TPA: hypothetical protein [Caudoviricetes sp.]